MNVIFISPNFPENYSRFPIHLSRHGVTVLGVGDCDFHDLNLEVRDSLSEYYRVPSLEDKEQVLQAGYYFKGKYGTIDRIESLQEYWIPLEAYLRDELDVTGLRSYDIEMFRNKYLMKEQFRAAGLRYGRGEILEDEKQALRFAKKTGYPVILKPSCGVGATSTYKLDTQEDLISFLALKDSGEYLIEEYLDGDVCSLDGLVDKSGEIVFSSLMAYPQQTLDVVNNDSHIHYYTEREIPSGIAKTGEKLISVLKLKNSFFHFEFFLVGRRRRLYALEINARPPGLLATDMWNYSCDMDVYDRWAALVSNGSWEDTGEPSYHVSYVGRKNHFDYHHSHEQVLEFCWPKLVHFEQIPEVFRDLGGDIAYILRAEKLDELLPCVEYIQAH